MFKNSLRNVSSSCQYRLGNVDVVVVVGIGIVVVVVGIVVVGIIGDGGVIMGMGMGGGFFGSGIIVPTKIVVMGGGIGIIIPMGECDGGSMIGNGKSWSGVVVVVLLLKLLLLLPGTLFDRVELIVSILLTALVVEVVTFELFLLPSFRFLVAVSACAASVEGSLSLNVSNDKGWGMGIGLTRGGNIWGCFFFLGVVAVFEFGVWSLEFEI